MNVDNIRLGNCPPCTQQGMKGEWPQGYEVHAVTPFQFHEGVVRALPGDDWHRTILGALRQIYNETFRAADGW